MNEKTLIYDIETSTDGMPDPKKDGLKFFGCYSYITDKYYMFTNTDDIQKMINKHKYIVNFNGKRYDDIILKRYGINMEYKIILDLYDILKPGKGTKGRALIIQIKKGLLKDLLEKYSLDFITKTLGLTDENNGKEKIDYTIFNKNTWTKDEKLLIMRYLKKDIELTKKLYEWLEKYFDPFKDFLNEEDIRKKVYINSSPAKLGYKAICHSLGWNETYGGYENKGERISGGYVSFPAGEYFEDGVVLDFASEYPHAMMMCNLYGAQKNREDSRPIWTSDIWKIDGKYYTDKMAEIGMLIKKWYTDRMECKKNKDKKEYAYKILMNLLYGILDNAYYTLVYNKIAAQDCTNLGKQWILYGRKVFREAGYKVVYSDTDSIFLQDPYNDTEKILQVKEQIIKHIKSTVPFPQDTFDLKLEYEIKYFFFFKGKPDKGNEDYYDEDDINNRILNLMKKNYILVTKDGKVIIKNLGIKKKSNSKLSKKIFWEHMIPKIKQGTIKFSKTWISNIMQRLLNEDIELALMRKEVHDKKEYIKSTTGIQYQISNMYGAGIHFLIPNTKIGAGKGSTKYCTLKDFNDNKLKIGDINKEIFFNELGYFIKEQVTKNIFEF